MIKKKPLFPEIIMNHLIQKTAMNTIRQWYPPLVGHGPPPPPPRLCTTLLSRINNQTRGRPPKPPPRRWATRTSEQRRRGREQGPQRPRPSMPSRRRPWRRRRAWAWGMTPYLLVLVKNESGGGGGGGIYKMQRELVCLGLWKEERVWRRPFIGEIHDHEWLWTSTVWLQWCFVT